MSVLNQYISRFNLLFGNVGHELPWKLTANLPEVLLEKMSALGPDYSVYNGVAIHKTAAVDDRAILKGPAIIGANCFIGAYSIIRGGVFLDEHVSVGPGCEVKSSFIFSRSALGHFNYVGDSLLGSNVNMEAGAVIANHYNERKDKNIVIVLSGKRYATGLEKFGAIVGDSSKIGANAVLSPGTALAPASRVARLELVDQASSREGET